MYFFFFLASCLVCEILLPDQGLNLRPPTEEAWHANHWTTRQVPHMPSFVRFLFKIFAQLKTLVICILILIHILG